MKKRRLGNVRSLIKHKELTNDEQIENPQKTLVYFFLKICMNKKINSNANISVEIDEISNQTAIKTNTNYIQNFVH